MVEKKKGRPSTQQLDEQRGDIVWQRLAEEARSVTLDPRMTSQIMRWRVKKLLTDSQAAAADKIGQIYGRFERLHGVKRSTRSPSYEFSTAGEQEPRVKIDGNWYYPGDREYDAWARGIDEEWGDLQKLMPARDRDARQAIEDLCVENRAISSYQLRLAYRVLNEVSEHWGLGPTAAADESTPLAATRSKLRASRQEKFEKGAYAVSADAASLPSRFHAPGSAAARDHEATVRKLEESAKRLAEAKARQVFCECEMRRVDPDRCDRCDHGCDDFDAGDYEDPPLYPVGKLAGMTLEELEAEHARQCNRQGRLGDADHIDDRAVEETEMRCRAVEVEIKSRRVVAT